MTKKGLIEALAGLTDDAEVHIYCTSLDMDGGEYAHDVYIDDRVDGDKVQNEITILAHF